jgi:hypothetical protein
MTSTKWTDLESLANAKKVKFQNKQTTTKALAPVS